jgi:PadR family transcriptional regulator PadR
MNAENSKSQMKKGIIEYCILLIINNKPSYAPDIIRILQKAKLIVVEGTLYPLLTRFKNMNLLSYQWIESNQGPPRKYYALTDEGKTFLDELENDWEEISKTIAQLKSNDSNTEI